MLSADLGLKTRIPSAQASYLLLFIWSPVALCLTCSFSWVSYSISRMHPVYLFSEFQNFPSWRTGLLLWFFPLSNLLVNAANGFSHQVIIVLSPQSSLSWCQIAPLSWVQSLVNYGWEPEFHIVQNTASFFFPQKSTLLLRSWAFAICPDVSLLAHLYKGKSTSVQFSDLGQVQLECLGVCAISLVWEEGVKEEFIIPIVGFLWSRVSGFLEKEKGTMPEVAIWQGLPHCAQVSFPPRRGIIPLL